jgi:hypothetical protein
MKEDGRMTRKVAVGWFPADELEKALALWPGLVAGWEVHTYVEYCRGVDRHLRQLDLGPDATVVLAPIEVKYYVKWCANEGRDPAEPSSRAAYATTIATRGRVRSWPPGPDKACWCGRDESYALCCGVDA